MQKEEKIKYRISCIFHTLFILSVVSILVNSNKLLVNKVLCMRDFRWNFFPIKFIIGTSSSEIIAIGQCSLRLCLFSDLCIYLQQFYQKKKKKIKKTTSE